MRQTTHSTPMRPVARHGRLKVRNPFVGLLKGLAVALSVVLVSAAGVGAWAVTDVVTTFTQRTVAFKGAAPAPAPGLHPFEGEFNMLLVGSDECEPKYYNTFKKRCSGSERYGQHNDVNLLVHISAQKPRRITVISFPRDLMIPIPSCEMKGGGMSARSDKGHINDTLAIGGPACTAATIEKLIPGIRIGYVAAITWGGVIDLTKAVGGVDVCVTGDIDDPYTHLKMTKGKHTIAGKKALQFLRTRHGVADGSDLGRISNQQQYMSNLVKKMTSGDVLNDPAKLYMLAGAAAKSITKSANLTDPSTLVQLALVLKEVDLDQVVFVQYPTGADPDDSNRVVPIYSQADALFAAVKANKPLKVAKAGRGVDTLPTTATPKPTTAATTAPTTGATPAPSGTAAAPGPAASVPPVLLGDQVTGTTAADTTCGQPNR